jgi:hypothetical protein
VTRVEPTFGASIHGPVHLLAAAFVLAFTVGDGMFPMYFLEEYVIYGNPGGACARSEQIEARDAQSEGRAGGTLDCAELEPGGSTPGDCYLRIFHVAMHSPATRPPDAITRDPAKVFAPPLPPPRPFDHPPRHA